ncbi:tetratricopeptide repeat protein [Dyella mobilis]|uniref:SEL1-like repeat protein n=1 Tax=Dyella mobilis TaxID=1849582 RepID=A0ABS2KBW0_9GAMM|nr:tetratricopeptide repeat protein [Dyella mobilis]MBM7128671.1 SEL1-like repeat protein [Dyella mobilis]
MSKDNEQDKDLDSAAGTEPPTTRSSETSSTIGLTALEADCLATDEPALDLQLEENEGADEIVEDDDGTALAKLRQLIRTRTRFHANDVQPVSEAATTQFFRLSAKHVLKGELKSLPINGRTVPSASSSSKCTNAIASASADHSTRLALGMRYLEDRLNQTSAPYNAVKNGLWLPHACTHYDLQSCSSCFARGRVTCHACHGACNETCLRCSGRGKTDCYQCYGSGKVNCSRCHGSMQVDMSGTEYYSETVWVNGQSETQYKSRWVTKREPCYQCNFGKVNCNNCSGSGHINCTTCHSTGRITCQTCAGVGDLKCLPCDGSGHVGTAAWMEVHHEAEYAMSWCSPPDSHAADIESKAGLHRIAHESHSLSLTDLHRNQSRSHSIIQASYAGVLQIMHLDAKCNQESYHVVAFGKNRQWHDLDDIVADLLSGDLEALRTALVASDEGGLFTAKISKLAAPLRHVVDSELNTALVDATLHGRPTDELRTILSPEYADKLRAALLSALKRIYTSIGASTWWPTPLILGLTAGALWWLHRPIVAVLVAAFSFPASIMHLQWKAKAVLTASLGNKAKAEQAIALVKKARHHRLAHALHYLPSALLTALAVFGFTRSQGVAITVPNIPVFGKSSAISNTTLSQAMTLFEQRQFAQARPLLLSLAEGGEKAAYLPLAKVLMFDDQGTTNNLAQINRISATTWAIKAVNAYPDDADALYVAGDLSTSGWNKPVDMNTGISLLKRSAARGNANAMHLLGLIYINGAHVPRNAVQARYWFTEAANAGQAADMYNVGLMDWKGEGSQAPNRTLAREWWSKAAALGDERAKKAIAELPQQHH